MVRLTGFKEFTRRVEGKSGEETKKKLLYESLFTRNFDQELLEMFLFGDEPSGVLEDCFLWADSPEGSVYWAGICAENCCIDELPDEVELKVREIFREYDIWLKRG
jgi:hypothetical protein